MVKSKGASGGGAKGRKRGSKKSSLGEEIREKTPPRVKGKGFSSGKKGG